jgi:hypothetical protein
VSFAVYKNSAGTKLKQKLDKFIKQLPLDTIFSRDLQWIGLPENGKIPTIIHS